jgi:hypothetical protein
VGEGNLERGRLRGRSHERDAQKPEKRWEWQRKQCWEKGTGGRIREQETEEMGVGMLARGRLVHQPHSLIASPSESHF